MFVVGFLTDRSLVVIIFYAFLSFLLFQFYGVIHVGLFQWIIFTISSNARIAIVCNRVSPFRSLFIQKLLNNRFPRVGFDVLCYSRSN